MNSDAATTPTNIEDGSTANKRDTNTSQQTNRKRPADKDTENEKEAKQFKEYLKNRKYNRSITDLSPELLSLILQKLPNKDQINFSFTSKFCFAVYKKVEIFFPLPSRLEERISIYHINNCWDVYHRDDVHSVTSGSSIMRILLHTKYLVLNRFDEFVTSLQKIEKFSEKKKILQKSIVEKVSVAIEEPTSQLESFMALLPSTVKLEMFVDNYTEEFEGLHLAHNISFDTLTTQQIETVLEKYPNVGSLSFWVSNYEDLLFQKYIDEWKAGRRQIKSYMFFKDRTESVENNDFRREIHWNETASKSLITNSFGFAYMISEDIPE